MLYFYRFFMIKKYLLIMLFLFFTSILLSWFVAGELVSPAFESSGMPDTDLPVESFFIPSQSGSVIAGWHIKADNNKGVVLLYHGIRANKGSMLKRAQLLYKNGFSVVLIDFQAHGESAGDNITIGYLEKYDVLASIEYAKKHHLEQPVGLIGVSLGGASILLASPQNVNAIVIESAYPDIRSAVSNRVKAKLGFLYKLPSEILLAQLEPRLGFKVSDLSPIEKIHTLKSPLFVVSGSDDKHTTKEETVALFSRAAQPKKLWIAEGVGHQDIYAIQPDLYEQNIIDFLLEHMKPEEIHAQF